MIDSFWTGRRVLITGHTGFKGGWLSLWLNSLDAQVTGLALAPATPSFFHAVGLDRSMTSLIGDIRDYSVVQHALKVSRAEFVFHMAAQPLVRASYRDPVGSYATNVMGTVHVLEAVRQSPDVRSLVVVTTDKCYENREWPWGYRENDRLGGHDPYSSSKACAEIATAAFRKSYFDAGNGQRTVGVATVRAGNVIGGGDWAEDRLIPDLVRAVSSNEEPILRNPSATRPWQHVLEPLRGYLILAERLATSSPSQYAGAWNFGPADGDSRSVSWVAARFLELWGISRTWIRDESPQPHEAHQLRLDTSKARRALNWEPVTDLDHAIAQTVAWYKSHHFGEDIRKLSLDQIHEYVNRTNEAEYLQAQ